MNKANVLILLVIAVIVLCSPVNAVEFRGAWVSTWGAGFRNQQEINETLAAVKKAGLNALVVEVRKAGDAYYDSKIEPIASDVPAGFDPLAYTIEKAHAEGMQVHAWVVVYRVWKGKELPSDPKHVLRAHPEWRNISYDGKTEAAEGVFLDPGIPEYREHFARVCEDIVKHYAVDGIHYDYVRYPGQDWGYSEIALKRYYAETGAAEKPKPDDPKWLQWKRDQVTAMVKLVHDRVKAINPNVKIQASTIPWGDCPQDFKDATPYREVCQDWRSWMEQGLIDENCPMVYSREGQESGAKYFRGWVDGTKRWSYGRSVYIGMSATWNTPEQMMQQIDAARKGGLQGFLLFSFDKSKSRDARAEGLGKLLGPAPKLPVNHANGIDAMAAHKAFNKGIELAKKNKLDKAITELIKATKLDPGYAEAYFRIGRCYLRSKNATRAHEFFEKALAADPTHEGARKALGE